MSVLCLIGLWKKRLWVHADYRLDMIFYIKQSKSRACGSISFTLQKLGHVLFRELNAVKLLSSVLACCEGISSHTAMIVSEYYGITFSYNFLSITRHLINVWQIRPNQKPRNVIMHISEPDLPDVQRYYWETQQYWGSGTQTSRMRAKRLSYASC